MELHLVDYCNLNCKDGGHFSSIADKFFADIDQYRKDIETTKPTNLKHKNG